MQFCILLWLYYFSFIFPSLSSILSHEFAPFDWLFNPFSLWNAPIKTIHPTIHASIPSIYPRSPRSFNTPPILRHQRFWAPLGPYPFMTVFFLQAAAASTRWVKISSLSKFCLWHNEVTIEGEGKVFIHTTASNFKYIGTMIMLYCINYTYAFIIHIKSHRLMTRSFLKPIYPIIRLKY